ncbi:MAG: 3-deoxy-manno-octulosonate cytidylyltransferase [Parachlamydiales bacterium]|nr:3-deoxy-manno-octulosonate cytidylyltransferase [Parachlamydiales bacterium]
MKEKVFALIPARLKSSRFFAKPLALIQGKSLIRRTFENAFAAQLFDEIIVATDDRSIYDHVKAFHDNVVMTSSECPSGTHRIAEVVSQLPYIKDNDIIMNVQGDNPCILQKTFASVISSLQNTQEAAIATAAAPIEASIATSPHVVKVIFDHNRKAMYFSRSLIPYNRNPYSFYYYHIGLYAYRAYFLKKLPSLPSGKLSQAEDLEQLQFMENGYEISVALVDDPHLSVDIPEDIEKIERYLSCL